MPKRTQKRNLFSWLIYDFGNSFVQTATGGLFFVQWIILDNKVQDIWYSVIFSSATILALLISPLIGTWSDRIGKRLPFILWLTVCMYILMGFLVGISTINSTQTKVFLALAVFLILQTLYQLSLVLYNTLVESVSSKENIGKITGIGEAFNNIGWILGTAILLPFAIGKITVFGVSGRTQVFLPATIGFILFSLPIFWFKERQQKLNNKTSSKDVYKYTLKGLVNLFKKQRNVGRFLLGFSFVSDAILTAQIYFAILTEKLYGATDRQKFTMLIITYVSLIITNYIAGLVIDKKGAKKVLITSCVINALSLAVIVSSSTISILYLATFVTGIGIGCFYTSTRTILVNISPKKQLGEYFGLFSTFQRFASVVGPMVWGLVILIFTNQPILRYRFGGLSLIILMLIGMAILLKIEDKRKIT